MSKDRTTITMTYWPKRAPGEVTLQATNISGAEAARQLIAAAKQLDGEHEDPVFVSPHADAPIATPAGHTDGHSPRKTDLDLVLSMFTQEDIDLLRYEGSKPPSRSLAEGEFNRFRAWHNDLALRIGQVLAMAEK